MAGLYTTSQKRHLTSYTNIRFSNTPHVLIGHIIRIFQKKLLFLFVIYEKALPLQPQNEERTLRITLNR